MDQTLPTVTVVIPTRNNERELMRDLVPSLFARTPHGFAQDEAFQPGGSTWTQTIIVDQSPGEETKRALEASGLFTDPRIEYLWTPREKGISRARNAGIGKARGDLIAFLDSDIIVRRDHVASVARIFATHPEIQAMFAPVVPHARTSQQHGGGIIPAYEPSAEHVPPPSRRLWTWGMGANHALRRGVALRFPYDEALGVGTNFPSHEEVDQIVRMTSSGHSCGIFLHPRVEHTGVRLNSQMRQWANDTERGRGAMHAKHLLLGDLSPLREGPGEIVGLALQSLRRTGRPSGIRRLVSYYGGFFEALLSYRVDRGRAVFGQRRA
jgi:hypothetical protein